MPACGLSRRAAFCYLENVCAGQFGFQKECNALNSLNDTVNGQPKQVKAFKEVTEQKLSCEKAEWHDQRQLKMVHHNKVANIWSLFLCYSPLSRILPAR